jgi:hypothetical protein
MIYERLEIPEAAKKSKRSEAVTLENADTRQGKNKNGQEAGKKKASVDQVYPKQARPGIQRLYSGT